MENNVKKKFRFNRIISLLTLLSGFYIIYNILLLSTMDKILIYLVAIEIFLFDLVFIILSFRLKRKIPNILLLIVLILTIGGNIYAGLSLNHIYSDFKGFHKTTTTSSSSLITLKSSNIEKIDDVKDTTIGITNDTKSIDGYILAEEIIKENNLRDNNKIKEYDGYTSILKDLYNKKIDAAFLPTNYVSMFASTDDYEKIEDETKIIISKSRDTSKTGTTLAASDKKVTEPFTMLLMGIDSTKDGLSNADSFNGDSLMVITFNPKTLNATVLSIPRDTYVPIMCFAGQYKNKITHSAWNGAQCVIDTVENFLDVKLDYYMKINFTGLVDLVNAVDGVEVDVPYSFCEQDSKRRFGSHMIYVKKGLQTLNGEQALALSRNRKTHADICTREWTLGQRDDFVRGTNQQLVIQGIIDKIKNIKSINKIYDILDAVNKNLDTNMSTDTILSFYDVLKDIMANNNDTGETVNLQTLTLDGSGEMIYDEHVKLTLWNFVPNELSVEEVKDAIKINLGLKEYPMEKDFDFSITREYKEKIAGKIYS